MKKISVIFEPSIKAKKEELAEVKKEFLAKQQEFIEQNLFMQPERLAQYNLVQQEFIEKMANIQKSIDLHEQQANSQTNEASSDPSSVEPLSEKNTNSPSNRSLGSSPTPFCEEMDVNFETIGPSLPKEKHDELNEFSAAQVAYGNSQNLPVCDFSKNFPSQQQMVQLPNQMSICSGKNFPPPRQNVTGFGTASTRPPPAPNSGLSVPSAVPQSNLSSTTFAGSSSQYFNYGGNCVSAPNYVLWPPLYSLYNPCEMVQQLAPQQNYPLTSQTANTFCGADQLEVLLFTVIP
uniref:Uncharacterized protein n=1 Tax=Meloidogyne hapla TaxID=6305 RepID=A0A1I8B5Q1_MELHA